MKRIFATMALLFSAFNVGAQNNGQHTWPTLEGPYLGQMPPRSTPEVFAPGIVNTEAFTEIEGMFAMGMKAFYFIRSGGKYGQSDLYISFRAADGTWGPAINMGDRINTASAENYPSVSPDGKFLFFDRREKTANNSGVDIFWVDAHIIETLRPKP